MNMAERIQYLRKQKGFSQEELADKVGVSRQAVSKWEINQSIPDLKNIIIMSEIFETTTDYILKGIESNFINNKKSFESISLGFIVISSTIAGIWSFTANRFRTIESIFIILTGALVGWGISLIVKVILRFYRERV